ncbi:protoporphyrinogen oxidase [Streptomyces sp. ZYX-F-203]
MCASEARAGAGQVVVVGAGIAGLAAAHRLLGRGFGVTVLEASDRVGGKLWPGEVAGARVDLGAESMLARRPEAVDLAREAGLADRLGPPATATAALWTRGALRPLPQGHVMGVPGRGSALAGVLSAEGVARAGREPELPGTEVGEDVAVGTYVAARLGREVVDRLVEPLLGGVYAGDAYRLSLRSAIPALYEAARAGGSLTEAVSRIRTRAAAGPAGGPVFMGLAGGVGTLPAAVAEAVRARGGRVRTGTAVTALRRGAGGGWSVIAGGAELRADSVVLAVPAPAAAALLRQEAPGAAAELAAVEYASMALITLVYRRTDATALPEGSGFLVPPVDGRTIKASTFASQKWGWIAEENPDLVVVRTSVGRHGETEILGRDDAALVDVSRHDLREATGLAASPVATRVTRWDDGLPQYPVGHHARVARIREHVARLPGLAVCGAAFDGVGIPATIASAYAAVETLGEAPGVGTGPGTHPVRGTRGGAGE